MISPHEAHALTSSPGKTPVSLRISVTNRCQLQCLYCKPEKHKECGGAVTLTSDEIVRFVKLITSSFSLNKVHITGGDPLMRPDIIELIERLKSEGIEHIVLTTNGQLLEKKAHALKKAGLSRINISLDSLNPDTFKRLTRGGELSRTLAGIEAAMKYGISPVKLNTVVLKGINDNETAHLAQFGMNRNCQLRFLELMPIGVAESTFHSLFVSSVEIKNKLLEKYTLNEISGVISSSSRNFIAQNMNGKTGIIGFISPVTAPFCDGCSRLRLTYDGRLIGCLALNNVYDIRVLLRDEYSNDTALFNGFINTALKSKRKNLRFETNESMVEIGG